jgi:hypothetical protein
MQIEIVRYNNKRKTKRKVIPNKRVNYDNKIVKTAKEQMIIDETAKYFIISNNDLEQIYSYNNRKYYVARRMLIAYVLYKYGNNNIVRTAKILNKHHSTIINSLQNVYNYRSNDFGFEFTPKQIQNFENYIGNKINEMD